MPDGSPSRNYAFRAWCIQKGFTPKHGYELIKDGVIETFVLRGRRYVSEEADQRFDQITRSNTEIRPLPHRPESKRTPLNRDDDGRESS